MKARVVVLIGAIACGCGVARDLDTYRADTQSLLDTRDDALQSCYDQELRRNPNAAGTLTVTFTVEPKTGKVVSMSWDRNRTTVSEALATCSVAELMGLALEVPDRRAGEATFRYRFVNNPPPG